jgi:hypothetical protein
MQGLHRSPLLQVAKQNGCFPPKKAALIKLLLALIKLLLALIILALYGMGSSPNADIPFTKNAPSASWNSFLNLVTVS